jgi:hypothetical protein
VVRIAPIGAAVTLAPYDWGVSRHRLERPPADGDYLLAEGSTGYGSAYLITEARLMARSAVPGRYSLRCVKLAGQADIPEGARVLIIRWYRRDRRGRDRKPG